MHTNWDDLRFILSVAKQGSVAGAARAMGVNHSTVLRRVNAYEAGRGVRVFDRQPGGYRLTEAGQELVRVLHAVDDQLVALDRRVAGLDVKLEGRVRVTTTDSLSLAVLSPHLLSFKSAYPLIVPELSVTNGHLDFSRRDADITVRPCLEPPEGLTGVPIAPLGFRVYGSAQYLEANTHRALADHAWLGLGELLAQSPPARWLRRNVADARFVMRADSFVALGAVVAGGMGVALLPCCMERVQSGLVRLDAPIPDMGVNVWVLMHKDLQRAAVVRACADHLTEALREDYELLAGLV